jgi:peptidoglycan/xylan/chitin deacetylase (PgdA/CDA1 family)
LHDLRGKLSRGVVPDRAVAITFDDGYTDNLNVAKPMLERFSAPATVFVATGSIGSKRDFWWDQLATLLLLPSQLPETLELDVRGQKVRWRLLPPATAKRRKGLRAAGRTSNDVLLDRNQLYYAVYDELRLLNTHSRLEVLDRIAEWSGAPCNWSSRRPTLTENELCELARGSLIEIGAHTVTHPVLSNLTRDEQRREIIRSRERLREILERPITSFAYPYGGRRDFTRETACMVADAGFDCACSAETGAVWPSSDLYALPRISVRDWDASVFEKILRSRWRY